MALGTAIFLITLGAILRYAVTAEIAGVNIQTLGLIVMLVGVFGLFLALLRRIHAVDRQLQELVQAQAEPVKRRSDLGEQLDSVLLVQKAEQARLLANEARLFLEAEGYSSERIDELAFEFVAKGIGDTRDEFVNWALSQGQLGQTPSVGI